MKKGALLFLFFALAIVMYTGPSYADSVDKATDAMQDGKDMMDKGQKMMKQGKGMKDKGEAIMESESMDVTLTCIQPDEGGQLQSLTDFQGCSGTLVAVMEDKSAAIVATNTEAKSMSGNNKSVAGVLDGHTRGYVLASASTIGEKGASQNVEGALVCLLPNYEDGTVQPVVGTSPCGEKDQHLHVVHTKDGQVYALHGTEEAIKNLENSTERDNVKLQGEVQGEQGAWVLYVN